MFVGLKILVFTLETMSNALFATFLFGFHSLVYVNREVEFQEWDVTEYYKYQQFCADNLWIPFVCTLFYLFVIFIWQPRCIGLYYTQNGWNLFLAGFSMVGTVKLFPVMYHLLFEYEKDLLFSDTRTEWILYNKQCALWVFYFCMSKIPEFFDTFLLVLQRKRIIFLHVYHHIITMWFCWQSFYTGTPTGFYFAVMNFYVHSIMYFYYFMSGTGMQPKLFRQSITTIQIVQMFIGTFITFTQFLRTLTTDECDSEQPGKNIVRTNEDYGLYDIYSKFNIYFGAFMYASFLVLFVQFFIKSYVTKPKTKYN